MVEGVEELSPELELCVLPMEVEVFGQCEIDVLQTIRPYRVRGCVGSKLIDSWLLEAGRVKPFLQGPPRKVVRIASHHRLHKYTRSSRPLRVKFPGIHSLASLQPNHPGHLPA